MSRMPTVRRAAVGRSRRILRLGGPHRRRWRGRTASVTGRHESGVLDTDADIDLALLDPASLPSIPEPTAITMAELHQGVAMAKDAPNRAARTEKLVLRWSSSSR